MIRVEGDYEGVSVEIKGTEPILLAELSTIIKSLKENISRENIEIAIKLGFAEEKEDMHEIAKEGLKNKLEELFKELELDTDDKKEMDNVLEKIRKRFK